MSKRKDSVKLVDQRNFGVNPVNTNIPISNFEQAPGVLHIAPDLIEDKPEHTKKEKKK